MSDVFRALAGEWTLVRDIPGVGTVTGTASFLSTGPDLLRYREEGRFDQISGLSTVVYREYDYALDGDTIIVRFVPVPTTEPILHVLRLTPEGSQPWPATAADVHVCRLDTYAGAYRFESPDRFTVEMRVRGPAKDYSMHSAYTRGQSEDLSVSRPTLSA